MKLCDLLFKATYANNEEEKHPSFDKMSIRDEVDKMRLAK